MPLLPYAPMPLCPYAPMPLCSYAPPQAPHRGVRELGYLPEEAGVYISRWHHGSPSHRYGLYALHFILEVRGFWIRISCGHHCSPSLRYSLCALHFFILKGGGGLDLDPRGGSGYVECMNLDLQGVDLDMWRVWI